MRKSLAPKAEAKKAGRANMLIMMRMKPQNHPSQQEEPVGYSKYRRSSRYTLWKVRRARFVKFL